MLTARPSLSARFCRAGLSAWLFSGVVLVNLVCLWHWTRYGVYRSDDFQHTHIAWLTSQGRLVFRDFFDNHGPLSAWVNGAVLWLLGDKVVAFDGIVSLRQVVLLADIAQVVLVFLVARRAASSTVVGLGAAALFSGSYLLHVTGTMNRPDSLQNALLLLGVWLAMESRPFLAGVVGGLDLLLLFKGALGVSGLAAATFAVPLLLSEGEPLERLGAGLRSVGRFLGGTLAVMLPVVVFFAACGGAGAFWHGFIGYNFRETASRIGTGRSVTEITRLQFWKWFERDLVLAGMGLAGLLSMAIRAVTGGRDRYAILIGIVTLTVLPTWTLPLFPEVCLVTLPFMALTASQLLAPVHGRARTVVLWLLVAAAGGTCAVRWNERATASTFARTEARFRREIDWVVSSSERQEPVLYFWSSTSPAYVFNENYGRLWMLPADAEGGPWNSIVDADHLAESRRVVKEKLLTGNVEWVVIDPFNFNVLDGATKDYLTNRYERVENTYRLKR